MPYHCCVPRCNGNYDKGPKVAVFNFPLDNEQKKKWLRNIPRLNFNPSKTSKVCQVHFRPEDIITNVSVYDGNTGKMICANLDRPRLKPGAVPTLFPGCPEYLSVSQSTRESPQHKRERLENRHLENAVTESLNFAEEMKTLSVVSTFEGLLETLKNRKISPYWTQILKDQSVIFAHITFDNGPWIESCVNIDKNLLVAAYFKKKILKSLNGKSLPFVLNDLKDLFLVLDELSEFQDSNEIQNHMLSSVTELLENINSEMENVTLHYITTHHAFTHTTHAILELSSYCIQELGMQYFLPGKVQTDPLEERFGKYRQLAGSQYNISIRQMFECESKLRVQNSLTLILKSDKFGVINIKNLDFSESINQPSYKPSFNEIEIPNTFKNLSLKQSDFKNVEQQIPIFGYLAGYCILKLANELKCNVCNNELQIEYNDSNHSHKRISVSDRRGLKYTHNDVVSIIMINYIVVQKVVSDKFENDFLHVRNQRNLVVHLVTCQLTDELHHLDVCDNGHTVEYIINRIIHMTTNTLLKNYCSKKNDIKKIEPSKKRKLSTLQGSKILKSLPK